MKAYTYEDCRDLVSGWGLEKLKTLIVTHRQVIQAMKESGTTGTEMSNQANFVEAMEDELAQAVELIEEGVA